MVNSHEYSTRWKVFAVVSTSVDSSLYTYFLNDITTSPHTCKLHSQHFTFQWKLLVTVLFFPTDSWNGWQIFLNGTAWTIPKADNFFWTDSSSRPNGWLERIAQTVRTADKFFWTDSSGRSKTDDKIGTLWFMFLKILSVRLVMVWLTITSDWKLCYSIVCYEFDVLKW